MAKRRMNYNLVEGRADNSKYDILEESTEQVVKSFSGDKFLDARAFMRHLNLGGGFDGWTPSFFLKKIVLPSSKPVKAV
jgi:hypothetical protein